MVAACMHAEYGLIDMHAYTILGVVELKDGDKTA